MSTANVISIVDKGQRVALTMQLVDCCHAYSRGEVKKDGTMNGAFAIKNGEVGCNDTTCLENDLVPVPEPMRVAQISSNQVLLKCNPSISGTANTDELGKSFGKVIHGFHISNCVRSTGRDLVFSIPP